MDRLTSSQRSFLKSAAHHLTPVCYIGKNGLSEAVLDSVRVALDDHELVKVKFNQCKDEKRDLSGQLVERTECHLVGLVGNIAILYREQPDLEKRKVQLP